MIKDNGILGNNDNGYTFDDDFTTLSMIIVTKRKRSLLLRNFMRVCRHAHDSNLR